MIIWDDEDRRQLLMVARGDDLLGLPDVEVWFGPLRTTTHVLAGYGWALRMRQRTPRHVSMTRPSVILHPGEDQNFGFRFKLRARRPYRMPAEVIEDLRDAPSAQRFSLTKFETKLVPVTDPALADRIALLEAEKRELREELVLMMQNERRMIEDDSELEKVYHDNEVLRVKILSYEADPFQLLKKWTDEKLAGLRPRRAKKTPPDNVVDLVDVLRRREPADGLLEEKIERALRA